MIRNICIFNFPNHFLPQNITINFLVYLIQNCINDHYMLYQTYTMGISIFNKINRRCLRCRLQYDYTRWEINFNVKKVYSQVKRSYFLYFQIPELSSRNNYKFVELTLQSIATKAHLQPHLKRIKANIQRISISLYISHFMALFNETRVLLILTSNWYSKSL